MRIRNSKYDPGPASGPARGGRNRAITRRRAVAGLAALAAQAAATAIVLTRPDGSPTLSAGGSQPVPEVPGLPAIASPPVTIPGPLPQVQGTIEIDHSQHIWVSPLPSRISVPPALPSMGGSVSLDPSFELDGSNPLPGPGGAVGRPGQVVPANYPAMAATTPETAQVQLRALVVGTDESDWGVATWRSTLDRVGAAYDVLYAVTEPLTAATLVAPDGVGKYNAILLSNAMLLYQDPSGGYYSGFDGVEWNTLWAYERDFGVRQATLYASYGTFPEDYCLRPGTEGGVGEDPIEAQLTSAGAAAFDYLKADAELPIQLSYVYRDAVAPDCQATPVLTTGSDVLGVVSTSIDGRERLALTFTSNEYLLQSHLLVYGLFRWASHGLFLGERRHWINIDVDDVFNNSDVLIVPPTPPSPPPYGVGFPVEEYPGYAMTAPHINNARLQQNALRASYPLAGTAGYELRLNFAYNGGEAQVPATCPVPADYSTMNPSQAAVCLANEFRWLNHTLTHPDLNFTDYATNQTEIVNNLAIAQQLGLPVDGTVLKTGEYSGLGVYHPDPDNEVDPPIDYGLGASNAALLAAAKDAGVKYLHGNMSFGSHQPSCFNCGIYHPMEPSLLIVPDWTTNFAYFATNPEQETWFYNAFYGPNGRFAYWPTNLTYEQVVDYETDQALSRLASGSAYATTFHISNLRDYEDGQTLLTDWAGALLAKYSALYNVPLLCPEWPELASYVESRNAHFEGLSAGVGAIYDAATSTVTVTSPAAAKVTISGVNGDGATTYGSTVATPITVAASTPVTVAAVRLP